MKTPTTAVTALALFLAACSPGGGAADALDPGPADVATDVSGDVPGDVPADARPDAPGDLPSDVPADVPPDVPPPDPWAGLQPSGLPLGRIVGVASQMSTKAAPEAQRDFEYAQYAPYPGFRMRNGHRWEDVEREKGVWTWDGVEGSVFGARAGGSKVLMGLDYAPEWAREDPALLGTVRSEDFATYAGAMAGHFCADVKEYEIWNEPNLARFWAPAADPVHFADLQIAAFAAIKAACPDAVVAFGGMSSYDDVDLFDTWGFLRRALQARPELCDSMDVLALHPYTWFQYDPPEHDEFVSFGVSKPSQTAMVALARGILADAGCAPKPIWFTEVGWPSYELTEEQTARYAVRSLLLTAADGVDAWCWYTFWDFEPKTDGLRPHENYFGMFGWTGPDGTARRPKPSWVAVTSALDRLHGARFARDLAPLLGAPADVHALAFVDDAGAVTVAAWDGREMPDVTGDGAMEGGPGTTFALDLPLPAGTTATRLWDQDGAAQASPGAGASVRLDLSTRVQYLGITR